MALANFSDLKASIADWLARDDLTTQIDDFIDLFEAEFNRNMRLESMLAESTLTTSSSVGTVNLPTDFLELDNLAFNSTPRDITFVTTKQLKQTRVGNQNGRPTAFTITGSSTSGGAKRVQFGPTPDGTETLTALYYQKVPALSSTNTSNWLLAKDPGAYLYGSLNQSLAFISDSQRKAEIQSAYNGILSQMRTEDERNKAGGHGMRVITDTGNP